jgi:hypothetical protein
MRDDDFCRSAAGIFRTLEFVPFNNNFYERQPASCYLACGTGMLAAGLESKN